MNYTLEELEKTWNFYDNSAKEIIDNAVDVSFKFINEDMLKDYDKYIKNNIKLGRFTKIYEQKRT